MERFAIGLSLLVAGVVAVGSFFSFEHENGFLRFGGSRAEAAGKSTPAGAEALQPGRSKTFAAAVLEVRDAAARLTIVPEDRADIAVEVSGGGGLPALKAGLENGALVIDGELDNQVRSCNRNNDAWTIQVEHLGPVRLESAPQITVRAPRALAVRVFGAVEGQIGQTQSLQLLQGGCSSVNVDRVAGNLNVQATGSGDVHAGQVGSAEITAAGSGDVVLGDVGGALNAVLQGSGGIYSAAVAGPAKLDLRGSGSLSTGPVAGALTASLAGSGELDVARAQGALVSLSVAGSGDLRVKDGQAERLEVSVAGSGNVDYGGATRDLDANIAGTGNVRVRQATGAISKSVAGTGRVIIE